MERATETTNCAVFEGRDFHRGFVYLLDERRNTALNSFLGMDQPIRECGLKLDDQQSKKHSAKCRDQCIAEGGEDRVGSQFWSGPDDEGRDKSKERPEKTHIVEGVCKLDGVLLSE